MMKFNQYLVGVILVFCVSCGKKTSETDDQIMITVGKDSRAHAASLVKMGMDMVEQVNPDKIIIKQPNSKDSIALTSPGFLLSSRLHGLWDASLSSYEGQIIFIRRNRMQTLFSGVDKDLVLFVVEEETKVGYLIEAVSSYPNVEYIICDEGTFTSQLSEITVPIDKGVFDS